MDNGVFVIVLESAVLAGLVPAFIARAKGRSFVLWWLYGAGAIVVALPHALLASTLEPASGAFGPSGTDTMTHCPSCNESVRPHAVACRHCGFSFIGETDWSPDRTAPPANDEDSRARHRFDRHDDINREGAIGNGPSTTAAVAEADLPWTDEDFARISEFGPTNATSPTRRTERAATARWPHRRLAVVAVSGALAVWLLVLGVAALLPSPEDESASVAAPETISNGAGSAAQYDALTPPPITANAGSVPVTAEKPASGPTDASAETTTASSSAADTASQADTQDRAKTGDPIAFAASLPRVEQDARRQATVGEIPVPAERASEAMASGASATTSRIAKEATNLPADADTAPARPAPAASARPVPRHDAAGRQRPTARPADRGAAAVAYRSQVGDDGKVTAVGELILWMQKRLADLGYYKGRINGRAGPDTSRAILAYQRSAHLTPTGRINEALIVSLRRSGVRPVALREGER